jgi:HlyD family secretion protein
VNAPTKFVPKKKSRLGRVVRTFTVSLVLLGLLGGFAFSLWFLWKKSQGEPPVVKTEKPALADIVKKAVATGSIVPRKEVFIKPRVSGIVKRIYVEPGAAVKVGDLIADVTIIPDVAAITRAEGVVRTAGVALKYAELERARAEKLHAEGVLTNVELNARKLEFEVRQAELQVAVENLQVAKEGAVKSGKKAEDNTRIVSTVDGTVLDVPVLEGAVVIEANNFNEGTTIAAIADMGDMIFIGKVDEADVGRVSVGMDVSIQVGAIEGRTFPEGSIQFEVKAAVLPVKGVVIRAGYSANAGIVLDKRDKVLAISERLLQFEGKAPFVEIVTGPGQFERRDVKVGLSDGLTIEVLEGLTIDDEVKVPSPKGEDPAGGQNRRPGRR